MIDLAEYIFSVRMPSASLRFVAETLDRLIWLLDEKHGNQILETRDAWLEGDDPDRAYVALLMHETLPFKSRERAIDALSRLKSRWPQFSRECDYVIDRWHAIDPA